MSVEKKKLHICIEILALVAYVTEDKAAQAIYEALMNNPTDIAEMVGAEIKEDKK